MEWQIGIRAHDFGKRPLQELSEIIAFKGFGYIHLALAKAITDFQYSYGMLSNGVMRTIEKELSSKQLRVSVLGCQVDPSVADTEMYEHYLLLFKEHVRFAKEIGAGMIATETGDYVHSSDTGVIFTPQFERVARFFEQVVETAEKAGVKVVIESTESHTINCPETTKVLLDRINSPSFGVLFDCVNMIKPDRNDRQKELVDKAFSLYGEKINAFHIKDFTVKEGRKVRCSIGEGELELNYLMGKIKQYKPFSDIIIEGAYPEEAEANMKLLKDLLNKNS